MMKTIVASGAVLAALCASASADAAILVNFSFTGITNWPGTVTGQLQFVDAGVNVAASAVTVLTATNVALGGNYDALSGATVLANSFTVSSAGIVSSARFATSRAVPEGTKYLFLNYSLDNFYELDYPNGSYVNIGNTAGFAGVTYMPVVTAPLPEPGAWALMTLGFGAVGIAIRRSRARTTLRFA